MKTSGDEPEEMVDGWVGLRQATPKLVAFLSTAFLSDIYVIDTVYGCGPAKATPKPDIRGSGCINGLGQRCAVGERYPYWRAAAVRRLALPGLAPRTGHASVPGS